MFAALRTIGTVNGKVAVHQTPSGDEVAQIPFLVTEQNGEVFYYTRIAVNLYGPDVEHAGELAQGDTLEFIGEVAKSYPFTDSKGRIRGVIEMNAREMYRMADDTRNKAEITLVGNLGADKPIMSPTEDGRSHCRFSMAHNRLGSENALWFQVHAYNKQAEDLAIWTEPGKLLLVRGTVRADGWADEEGHKHSGFSVTVFQYRFLAASGEEKTTPAKAEALAAAQAELEARKAELLAKF